MQCRICIQECFMFQQFNDLFYELALLPLFLFFTFPWQGTQRIYARETL